jgi:hypothetical protein
MGRKTHPGQGCLRAYLKGGSPSCDRQGVAGEVLTRGGIKVIRVG